MSLDEFQGTRPPELDPETEQDYLKWSELAERCRMLQHELAKALRSPLMPPPEEEEQVEPPEPGGSASLA